MTHYYFIKLYHEVLHDPKMGQLPDRLWRRCIELFLLAGENDKEGELPDMKSMCWTLRTNEQELYSDLQILMGIGIIHLDESGDLIVTNFVKRQAKQTGAQRIERYRERKRKEDNSVTESYKNVTQPVTNVVPDIDIDIDIDSIAKEKPSFAQEKPVETPKKKREPTPKEIQRNDLQKYFLMKSGLPLPRDIKELNKMWWTPLTDILTWVDYTQERAEILVDESLSHARKDNLTISSPLSIKKIASDLYAKRNGNGNH